MCGYKKIGFEIGYFGRDVFESLDKECEQLGKMIGALIKARKDRPIASGPLPLAR